MGSGKLWIDPGVGQGRLGAALNRSRRSARENGGSLAVD